MRFLFCLYVALLRHHCQLLACGCVFFVAQRYVRTVLARGRVLGLVTVKYLNTIPAPPSGSAPLVTL